MTNRRPRDGHQIAGMRREPLGAVPGFRAVCTCGESAWWLDEWQVDEWWARHRGAS